MIHLHSNWSFEFRFACGGAFQARKIYFSGPRDWEIASTFGTLWGQPKGSGDCKNVDAVCATRFASTCVNHFVSPERVSGLEDINRVQWREDIVRSVSGSVISKSIISIISSWDIVQHHLYASLMYLRLRVYDHPRCLMGPSIEFHYSSSYDVVEIAHGRNPSHMDTWRLWT
jgi:hypothetical protein